MRTARLAGPAAVLLLAAAAAPAQYTATKIVETGVSYPGVNGPLTAFPGAPSISGGTIAFAASTASSPGIYTWSGGTVTPVATNATAIPGGTGNFTAFAANAPAVSAAGVAFGGNGNTGTGNSGVYSTLTGSLQPVVNNATAYPTTGTFTGFSIPSVSGTTAVFSGTNSTFSPIPLGVFTRTGSGSIVTLASTSTAAPGAGGNFTAFSDSFLGPFLPFISGSNVVFGGQAGGRTGLYASVGGTLSAVATTATTVPGTANPFTTFGLSPAIDGSTVAFVGTGGGRTGVYAWSGGGLATVADPTTAAPGGGTFSNFGTGSLQTTTVALNGGHVVFEGFTSTGAHGIYTDLTGSLTRVVAVGDVVGGKTVAAINMSDYALSGSNIAVSLKFTDNSYAVYTFTPVPEPAGVLAAVAAIGGLAAGVRRLRRGRAAG